MKIASKALGSSLIIVLFFSFFLSLLLYGIFNVTYSDRHDYCSSVSMSVQPTCETRDEKIKVTLRNDGSRIMYYEINSELDSVKNVVMPSTVESVIVEMESKYKLIPYVKGDDESLYACITQTKYVSSSGAIECI